MRHARVHRGRDAVAQLARAVVGSRVELDASAQQGFSQHVHLRETRDCDAKEDFYGGPFYDGDEVPCRC